MNRTWSIATMLAVLVLTAGAAGCSRTTPAPMAGRASTAHAAFSTTVPGSINGHDLVQQWVDLKMPCSNPIGSGIDPMTLPAEVRDKLPTVEQVGDLLAKATALGSPEFIIGRLQALYAALLQTQADIAVLGTDSVMQPEEIGKLVKIRRDKFDAYEKHVLLELADGKETPDPLDKRFPLGRTCP